MGAALPPIVTLTLASVAGKGIVVARVLAGAKFVPLNVAEYRYCRGF
jgi:hypothetical protein